MNGKNTLEFTASPGTDPLPPVVASIDLILSVE
jgi:hypothetical protein